MVEKRKSDLDSIQKRQHSITQTLHSIIFDNDINVKLYSKIEIEEQKNKIEMLTKKLQMFENIYNNSKYLEYEIDDKENKLDTNRKETDIIDENTNEEIKNETKERKQKIAKCYIDDKLRSEIVRLEKELLECKNEMVRLKNSKQKTEIVEEEKNKEQITQVLDDIDLVILKDQIKNREDENINLRNEINRQVSEILNDRNRFADEIEKINNEYEQMCKKNKEEKVKLNDCVFELHKKLNEAKTEIAVMNEKYAKMKAQLEEIEKLIENDAEKANLYKEIIKLTKLYEENLENANLYLIKKNEYEKQENKKRELEEENVELKEKLSESEKIKSLFVERNKYEKLMVDYIERKNAANYHKRNSIKAHNDLECLERKLKDIERKKNSSRVDNTDELENYRKLLRCTSCDKNYKDTIILRCMHVFCKECIDNRIKTRNRNCPSCNENFHTADVKKIYL